CTRTIAPTDNGEGSYVLTVVDTDAVGNQGVAINSTPFVIDRTDPGAPSITASPVSPSQALTASWTVAANDPSGKDLICRFVPNGDLTGAWSVCGPTVTWSPLPGEGSYVLQVRARDAAGNLSTIVASSPYVVDRTAPAAAVFTSAAATNFVTSATWTWTGEAGATAECQLQYNGLPPPGESLVYHPCASPQTESLTRGDGSYTLLVRLTDAALNTNTAVTSPIYDLDTARPDPPVVSGPSGPSKQTTVSWTYTTTETRTPSLYCQLSRSATATGTATIVEALAPCTSLTRTLPTLTADGYYVFSLQLQDRAGNLSPLGSSNPYLLDTTPPNAPVFTQAPSGTANLQSVVWAFTRDADATAECQLLLNGSPVKTWASCGTPHGETLTAGDGPYVLQVRLTDPVGNTGAPVNSVTYTLDRTPPGAPTVTGPGGTSNKTTADYAISSTVEAGATAECRLTFETTPGAWTSCVLPKTYSLGADGSYFLEVRLTDQYGNLGLPGQSPTYLLDTKAPAAPVVTAPPSPAKVSAPVFTFTSDSDVTNLCSLARGGVVVATADGCRGSYTANLTGLADGDYVLTVRSTDAAGNATSGTSGAYTYDTTAPIPPSVTGPKGPSQNRTPVFTWTGEIGAKPECSLQVEGGSPGGFVACASPYQPTLNADGTWVLTVRLTDAAGNVSDPGSSGGYLLDTTAPAAPVVVAPASPGRDLAPSWSAAVESGAFTECRLIGPSGIAAAFAPCSLPMTTPVGSDGTYTLEVRATDAAGNVSAVGSGTYVLDTVPPGAPNVADPTSPGRSRTPVVTFTTEPGTTTTCRVSKATTVITASAPCTSPATLDLAGQPDGAYTLSVRAVDLAGNVGPASTATYVLDTAAPAAPIMTLIAGSPSSDRSPAYAFNYETGAVALCRLSGGLAAARDLPCTNTLTVDLANAADGTYTLSVSARDLAGNVSPATTTTYLLDSTAPVAPKVVGPATPGANRAPVWKITASGPTECRLLRNATTYKDWAPCGSSYLADLFGQPDAVYALEVRLIGSTAATFSRYRLKTTGPAAPVLTSPPSPSTARRAVWSVASPEIQATAECRVLLFGAVFKDWAP
ncbi:MAG: Ig-like domain-containing protein, partial [Mycobacteriales bacterium]